MDSRPIPAAFCLRTTFMALLVLVVVACNGDMTQSPPLDTTKDLLSRDAKVETLQMLRDDLEAERHPSDGGGKAWLVEPGSPTEPVPAGSSQRFEIIYEAGPLGLAENGMVFIQPSPFWGWDPPQAEIPDAPGFTEVATQAEGIELETKTLGGLVAVHLRGRGLEEGERIRMVYGAGPAGARVDRYTEHRSRIWIAVDGDGDGIRAVLADSPSIYVSSRRASRLILSLPSTARPGERARLTIAVVDGLGNAGMPYSGVIRFQNHPDGLVLPEEVVFAPEHQGCRTIEVVPTQPGLYRLHAISTSEDGTPELDAESNPLVVRDGIPRLLWGDLHGHSQQSDGTGTPEDYYQYARDVAGLDVVALTDHDHWGMRFIDQNPEMWEEILQAAQGFNEPGRFVALVGYEWTSWLYGHRHVLYFSDHGELFSSFDPRYETPGQLWEALADRQAITIAHHSAGGPVSTSWDFLPEPSIEPVIEVVSVHGSSEAGDSSQRIYDPVEGNFVRDTLDQGLLYGFLGSGDGHDGHPGLAQLGSPTGGLAAIFSEELDRRSILQALRARRVYATNGPRIWLRMWLEEHPMGSQMPKASSGPQVQHFKFAVATKTPIERIDLIRSGEVVEVIPGEGRREWSNERKIPSLVPGEYVYLRVVQEDGGMAWASPIFAPPQ